VKGSGVRTISASGVSGEVADVVTQT